MCNFCNKEKLPSLKRGKINLDVYLDGYHLMVETYDSEYKYSTMAEINYCPVCGKELREKDKLLNERDLIGINKTPNQISEV